MACSPCRQFGFGGPHVAVAPLQAERLGGVPWAFGERAYQSNTLAKGGLRKAGHLSAASRTATLGAVVPSSLHEVIVDVKGVRHRHDPLRTLRISSNLTLAFWPFWPSGAKHTARTTRGVLSRGAHSREEGRDAVARMPPDEQGYSQELRMLPEYARSEWLRRLVAGGRMRHV